ncbi:hypothetical protein K443DRAFT_600668 [Laccaria amethystina LaAM-08-1]|uniref:Uncharacterized protein n=1 Tax=Laccaria amethystina LaAM-08-1 TaxID=1095629 RepID=A0A0C9XXP1_9AGAR|nr:hypothetical protein K443DRAFT_600668 [Laccaria amethystina LaAM-08-1]
MALQVNQFDLNAPGAQCTSPLYPSQLNFHGCQTAVLQLHLNSISTNYSSSSLSSSSKRREPTRKNEDLEVKCCCEYATWEI